MRTVRSASSPGRRPRRRLPSAAIAMLVPLLFGACSTWRGRISPELDSKVGARLDASESVDLESFARGRETIDEAISRPAPADPQPRSVPPLAEAALGPAGAPSPLPEPPPVQPSRLRGAASRSTFPVTIADVREEAL
ncbi:hypothetical protein KGQ64_05040 [bacterium]|nr:hypothetical protein [bacterium]